ncbi:MAG: sulfatase-like hydrolase/transferase, partial [bacterium]|nr:sulfatase-like hydrolase/transferase [bacterium]
MLAKVLKITIGGFLIGVIVSAVDLIYQLIQGSFYVSGFMSSMNFFGANTIVNWVFGCIVITVAVVITSFISLLRKREDRGYYKGIVIGCVVAFAMLMVITSAVPVNIVIHGFMNPKSLVFNGILSILGVGFIIFGLSIAGRLSRFFGLRPVKYIAIAISVISLIATVIGMSFYRDYEKLPLRESKTGPNVIIISFDALRRDYLSCYDDSKVNTPNLDKFAARSTLFENSFCNAPSTIPSMMTMNTGHYPSVHNAGLYHSAPRNMITLAQVLGSYDYRTEAYVGNNILYGEYGFSRGYNSYVEYGDLGEFLPFQRATLYRFISKFRSTVSKYFGIEKDITEWCTDVLIGAVERNHGKPRPYFLWVHYLDPHVPLTPPRKYIRGEDEFVDEALRFGVLKSSNGRLLTPDDSEYIVELYSGEVAYLDDMFGRVLTVFDDYGVWDDTMIIVTADHGEDHFDHGNYGHGYAHYRGILAVPLLVYLPDKTGGNRIHELASLIDVPA